MRVNSTLSPFIQATMSDSEFLKLSEYISLHCGIKMPKGKKQMVEGRLRKRLNELKLGSFSEYLNYIFNSESGQHEIIKMIDAITTNKTDFFREPSHFHLLKNSVIPALISGYSSGIDKPFRIWSAGCSTGEEPYTMAMELSDFASENPRFRFQIIASDLSTKVLKHAKKGVYDEIKVVDIPIEKKMKYLLKNKDRNKKFVRIIPELRSKINFMRLNFMDNDYGHKELMDVIFCRNVIIYFNKETQERILRKQLKYLRKGGFLFLGHSETLHGLDIDLESYAPTVYRKN